MQLYQDQPSGTVIRARQLRRTATEAEKRLLRALKEAFPTMKWRFQVPINGYYADFLCFGAKLIIEVDGGQHGKATGYDADRTRSIEREGYRVLRFWNNDVLANTDGVIASIQNSLSHWEHRVNSAPRCLDHAGGMIDPMLEGAAKLRKGEGDAPSPSPSPFPRLTARAPSLSQGEREL